MAIIIPEVYADLAQAAFLGKAKVIGSGAVLTSDQLVGQPGDSVTFPKWDQIADTLDDLVTGTPMSTVAMGQTSNKATIKEAGKAVEIQDADKLTQLGNPESEAVRQFGIMAARKLDGDLVSAAQDTTGSAPLSATGAAGETTFSWNLLTRGFEAFGDEWEPDEFAGIYINSAQFGQAARDADFIDASKLGAGASMLKTGALGVIGGVNVFVTNRVAAGKILLVKTNALGALYKRRPIVETDRDILKRSDVVTTNVHYAVKRLNDRGVCVLTPAAA